MRLTRAGGLGLVAAAVVFGAAAFGMLDRSSHGQEGAAAARQRDSRLVGRGGPVAFAPGACVAFAPVTGWNGRTVFLDPGHGGRDSGFTTAFGGSVSESHVVLAIARRALAVLRRSGFRVVISRLDDSSVARLGPPDTDGRLLTAAGVHRDVVARNVCANAGKANALVAIHLNSFADPAVGGPETIYNASRPFRRRNLRLASLLQRAMLTSLARAGWSGHDRGIVTDRAVGGDPLTPQAAAYGQLLELGRADPPWLRYPSLMPGAVVEPLFLTSPAEARLALTRAGQIAIARGIADGLDSYFRSASAR